MIYMFPICWLSTFFVFSWRMPSTHTFNTPYSRLLGCRVHTMFLYFGSLSILHVKSQALTINFRPRSAYRVYRYIKFLWAFYFLVTVHVNITCKRWLKVTSDGRRNRQSFQSCCFNSIKCIKSLMNSSNRTDTQEEKKNPNLFFGGGDWDV